MANSENLKDSKNKVNVWRLDLFSNDVYRYCKGFHNKILQTGWLTQVFSWFWRPKAKTKVSAGLVSSEPLLGLQMVDLLLCSHVVILLGMPIPGASLLFKYPLIRTPAILD